MSLDFGCTKLLHVTTTSKVSRSSELFSLCSDLSHHPTFHYLLVACYGLGSYSFCHLTDSTCAPVLFQSTSSFLIIPSVKSWHSQVCINLIYPGSGGIIQQIRHFPCNLPTGSNPWHGIWFPEHCWRDFSTSRDFYFFLDSFCCSYVVIVQPYLLLSLVPFHFF